LRRKYVLSKPGNIETEAEYFDYIVRQIHMLPAEHTFPQYGITSFNRELSPFGAGYKISQLHFSDESYYNVRQPDQGAHA
jgi:hypothetical protein